MMSENSPIGVTASPVRNASFGAVPSKVSANDEASGRAISENAATPAIKPAESHRSCGLICMPIATKNTALNTSRMPPNVRST